MATPMRTVSLRNLAAHKIRLALTVLAVVLGTAFVSGSFVFTDTLQRTFDGIFGDTAQGADVRVSTVEQRSSGVPTADVQAITALPNVRAVQPYVGGQVVILSSAGVAVQTGGAPSIGQAYLPADQQLGTPEIFTLGKAPSQTGDMALNQGGASRAGLKVGDKTKVLVPAKGTFDVTLTGIYSTATDSGGYIGAEFTQSQANDLFSDGQHVQYIDVAGNGLTQDALRQEIATAFPALQVQTADAVRAAAQAQVESALSFFNYFLLAFGAIALLVGTFIIYNTFSMIVAQRVRELALLRAIGASRAQVSRSVVLEAFIVGVLGSVLGFLGGVALAYGLRVLLDAFDLGLPSGALAVEPRTVAIAFGVGIIVTVASAYAPARRAAKIPPVAAMREEFASAGDTLRTRTLAGTVLGVAGIAALVGGSLMTGGSGASVVGGGALAIIVAVLLASPALSRPIVGAIGAVVTRPFGAVGRLARTNAVRNPRRTAATAFALMLGLMLVSVIGVFGASAKASINTLVDTGIAADFILTGPQAIGVPVGAAAAAAGVSGVEHVASLHPVQVDIPGDSGVGAGVDGSLDGLLTLNVVQGAPNPVGTGMLVSQTESTDQNWPLGTVVTLGGPDGTKTDVTVTGIYKDNQIVGNWLVGNDVYQSVTPSIGRSDAAVLIKAVPGTDTAALRTSLEDATKSFIVVQVQDREQFKGTQSQQIDTLLAVLYALLALAVVISILGIINTLALSVVERRREIGMLRAVGMQRAQVRRTIYLESLLIAVFGAVVGVVLGVAIGWGFVRTLRGDGLEIVSVPWGQVGTMLASSAIVGVLAALWPAARASRTKPLEAITE